MVVSDFYFRSRTRNLVKLWLWVMYYYGPVTWRLLYRLPYAFALWPMVRVNYALRKHKIISDKWFWADIKLIDMGFWMNGSL